MSIVQDITDNGDNICQRTEISADGQLYVLDISNSIITYDDIVPNNDIKEVTNKVLKEIILLSFVSQC